LKLLSSNLGVRMKFKPFNRHLLLEPILEEKKEKQNTILVPEDYSTPKRYKAYKIVAAAQDCTQLDNSDIGKMIIVNNIMVEEVDVNDNIFYLLLENHVYGTMAEE